ncbi:MAG: quinolinate synthase NadA, partial [Methanophagales archaeon]|nr:quinolinate synthase NadA [Methanophagales archaeon]
SSKDIILSRGYCYVHENITMDQLKKIKETYPEAEVIVHPECNTDVRHFADFIGSTTQMSKHVAETNQKEFIVGTENNFVYRLNQDNPDKRFYPVFTSCIGMNQITLGRVQRSLENMEHKIILDEDIRHKAKDALERMLKL